MEARNKMKLRVGVREVMMKKLNKKNWERRGNAPRLHLHRVGMTKGHLKSLQVNLLTRISAQLYM